MAVEFKFIDNKNNALLHFKAMQKLEFKENRNGWIDFGKDNLYPQELIRLYDEHPEHRAIINRKARYIFGKGIKAKNPADEIKVNAFIEGFNKDQDLNQALKKTTPNSEIFNGLYIQVITNLLGKPIYFYFLKNANCRISECKTKLYYCKKWKKNTRECDVKTINKFEPNGKAGTYFIEWKYEVPTSDSLCDVYPIENYRSAVKEINTDIDISTFMENYVSNGFSVGTIIHFFQGVPPDQVVGKLDKAFKGTYTGEKGETVLLSHGEKDEPAPAVINIGIEELAEKFKFTSNRALQKTYTAHEMPPELFNRKFEDSFFSTSADLVTLEQLHIKGYVEPRQEEIIELTSYLSFLKTGEYLEMVIDPLGLVGVDIQNNPNFTEDEKREALGFGPKNPTPLGADGKPVPVVAKELNSTLTNLTGRQLQGLLRIVSKYDSDKINKEAAILSMMSGFGLSREDALTFLDENDNEPNIKLSSQKDMVLMALELSAQDDNDDEVILTEMAHIHNSKDALKYERQIMKFADTLTINVDELDSAVLNALKGNPTLTTEKIAKLLNSDIIKVEESLTRLIGKGFLENSGDIFKPTTKGINKDTEPPKQYEIYTVYKYALRDDAPALVKGGSSRPFCQKLMALSSGGKHWKFETIDKMENDLGTNVWDYRGGYYTNKTSGEIEPDCRHVWQAITKRRLVKK